jgi:oligoribonuclease
MSKHDRLVWIDLEMTGLDADDHVILEIATIITDGDLDIIATGPSLVIHQPEDELAKMDAWCVKHHGESGLTKRVRESDISNEQAENETLAFIKEHVDEGKAPLCGNSIWQDRRFLAKHMPKLEGYLHYRIVDVSSIKELVRRWYPVEMQASIKRSSHRALDDIKESINELRYYREHIFVRPD